MAQHFPDFGDSPYLDCFFASTTEGFLVVTRQGIVRAVNPVFCAFSGLSREDLQGKALTDWLESDDAEKLREHLRECGGHEPRSFTFSMTSGQGETLHLESNLNSPEAGTEWVCIFCRNLTEMETHKRDLRLLNDAMMAASNAIVICDRHGKILKVNRAFSAYTGYSANEAVGRSTKLLKSGRHPEKFYQEMWTMISRGEVWQGEIVNRKKDGTLYTEEMTITPIFSEQGEIENFIAIKQDITKRKALEDMFLRAQRLESVGTLASGVAHDLNNVLSPIIMSADLIMTQEHDPRMVELLGMIKEGAKRGADIVRQLLSFARGEEGGFVELQVRHILKDQIRVYRETFPRNITIESRLDRELCPVLGDSTQLHQVFANLMINARDAMPEGGNLLVEASHQVLDKDFVKGNPAARPGIYTRIRFQDDGIGMDEDTQSKIFDSFFTTKLHGKGTGLGLPTSLSIVKNHQGFLIMTSRPGEGTIFDVYLPVAKAFEGEGGVPIESEPPKGNGERILVVDDEESIGYMLRGTLVSLGYQVDIATSGQGAIDWVTAHPGKADFMMIDMMMPGMDGAQVIRNLRAADVLPPTLIMSGMVSDELLESTGINLETHFIGKPFTILQLAEKLDELIQRA